VSTRAGSIEGYLALTLMAFGYVWAGKYGPSFPEPYEPVIGISLWTFWLLFAVSGVRHGRGWGRVAAGVALAVFSLNAIANVVILVH